MKELSRQGDAHTAFQTALTLLATLFMSALVSGIAEEAGFRGYMQSMMERRHGPAVAIAPTSLVFGFAHLSHGFFLPALLFDMVWGALYGLLLVYSSGSILPGLLYHNSLDFLEFILAWKLGAKGNAHLVWVSGPDLWFWGNCLTVLVLGPVSGKSKLCPASVAAECADSASAWEPWRTRCAE